MTQEEFTQCVLAMADTPYRVSATLFPERHQPLRQYQH